MTDEEFIPYGDDEIGGVRILSGNKAKAWIQRFQAACCLERNPRGFRYELPPLFKDPNWKVIPLPSDAGCDCRIFDNREIDDEDRHYLANRSVSVDYARAHWPPTNVRGALWDMVGERGITEVAVAPWEPEIRGVTLGKPCGDDVDFAAFSGHPLMAFSHIECAIMDESGLWAMNSTIEETSVLGGEPDFIDEFVERSGGLPWLQAIHDIKFSEYLRERDSFRALYKYAGWSWPYGESKN